MSDRDFVTRSEFDDRVGKLDAALAEVKEDIRDTENRLRDEFTSAVRWWAGQVDLHLRDQDGKINWILGLLALLLITVIGALVYVAFQG